MAHQNHAALICVKCLNESLARINIQMVGWLIEQHNMGGIVAHNAKEQACLFAPRKFFDLRVGFTLIKAEFAQKCATFSFRNITNSGAHGLIGCCLIFQLIGLMLGKITDPQFAVTRHMSGHCREIIRNKFDQSGLAIAIRPQKCNAVIVGQTNIDFS